MVGCYIDTVFIQPPNQLSSGFGTLAAQAVDVLDDQHFASVQAVTGFQLEFVQGGPLQSVRAVESTAALIGNRLLDRPTLVRRELATVRVLPF